MLRLRPALRAGRRSRARPRPAPPHSRLRPRARPSFPPARPRPAPGSAPHLGAAPPPRSRTPRASAALPSGPGPAPNPRPAPAPRTCPGHVPAPSSALPTPSAPLSSAARGRRLGRRGECVGCPPLAKVQGSPWGERVSGACGTVQPQVVPRPPSSQCRGARTQPPSHSARAPGVSIYAQVCPLATCLPTRRQFLDQVALQGQWAGVGTWLARAPPPSGHHLQSYHCPPSHLTADQRPASSAQPAVPRKLPEAPTPALPCSKPSAHSLCRIPLLLLA